MTFPKKARIWSAVGGAAVLTVGLAIALQPGAAAVDSAPVVGKSTVSVTPSTGLQHGSIVQVTASGFGPHQTIAAGQCTYPAGEFICSSPVAPSTQFTTDSSGKATTMVQVKRTFQGYVVGGQSWGLVDCAILACYIGVGNHLFGAGSSALSFNPIVVTPRVALSQATNLKDGDTIEVGATGFGANQEFGVAQCAQIDNTFVCSTPTSPDTRFVTNGNGRGSAALTVSRAFEGFVVGGESWGLVDCLLVVCYIGVGNHLLGAESSAISFEGASS